MLQYVRQVAPQYRGQQLAGLGARASAGIGEAIANFGARLANAGEQQMAQEERESERAALSAAVEAEADFDNRYLKYMLGLNNEEKRRDLMTVQLDVSTGKDRSGYDIELDRFADWMKDEAHEISDRLSPRAKELFELEYNRKAASRSAAMVQTIQGLERQSVAVKARDLADSGRTAEALGLVDLYKDRFGPELHQNLSGELLVKGAIASLRQVAKLEGWPAAAQMLHDPAWQEDYGLDVPQADQVRDAISGFVNQGMAQAQAELDAEREKARDGLNDLLAVGQLTYDAIDASLLDEREQEQYVGWMRQDADRRLSGQKIATDEAVRHQIKAAALDIPRGRAEYRDVVNQANVAKAAGKLDDEAYRDVLAAARSELSGMQAEVLRSASQSATRQLVTVSESALERYAEMMARGAPGAKETLAIAENQRQLEYRLVDLHDSRVRQYLQDNPDATNDDLYRQSRKILLGLRKSDAAQRARMLDAWDVETMTDPAMGPGAEIEIFDQRTRQRVIDGRPSGPPAGLESIWDSISEEERATVLQLLRQGFLPDDILNHFRQQPAIQ